MFGKMGPQMFGIARMAKVADVIIGSEGNIRRQKRRSQQQLAALLGGAPVPHYDAGPDQVPWHHTDGEYRDKFSAHATWEQLRRVRPAVPWCKVVWFAQGVPRFTFITWLSIHNRLATGVRMRA